MAAATFAHGGSGGLGYIKLCVALKTTDASLLDGLMDLGHSRAQRFLHPEMLATRLANSGVSRPRL